MEGFDRLGELDRRGLADIASEVRLFLQEVGVPIRDDTRAQGLHGVSIEIDEGKDSAGGIYLKWHVGAALTERTNRCLLEGQLDHPDISYAGQAAEVMGRALADLLRIKGFVVLEVGDDDLRPYAIQVAHDRGLGTQTS